MTNGPALITATGPEALEARKREAIQMRLYTLEAFVDGQWVIVKGGLTATLAAFGAALEGLKQPGVKWRAVRDDGEVFVA